MLERRVFVPAQRPGDSIETLYVDIAARADQLVAEAEAAVQAVNQALDRIEKKTKETEGAFSKLGSYIKQSLSVAAGIGVAKIGGNLTGAVINFGKSLIDTNAQMQTFQRSFEVLTGSAEEAGEIIEWVREQAKATPFDVPGLIQASQQLMTWGLDLKEWFTVVGDTAAAMNRPLSQVVNAVGTLASGQTGEAVRRFRDLGINLREFEALKFDAQGSLVTPLEEAIPIVRQIMVDKFGGMMESQSQTWAGVMSNLSDTWQQFVQVLGEPIFETLNEALFGIQEWVEENQERIENFARDLGEILGGVLDLVMEILERFGDLFGLVDEVMTKALGEGYLGRAAQTAREIAGIYAGSMRGLPDLLGGLLAGEGLEEATRSAGAAMRETMYAVAGYKEEVEEVADKVELARQKMGELTEAQLAGVEAVRQYTDAFKDLEDVEIAAAAEEVTLQESKLLRALMDNEEAMGRLPPFVQALVESRRTEIESVLTATDVYHRHKEAVEADAEAEARHAANVEAAAGIVEKYADKISDAWSRYEEAVQDAQEATDAAIEEIRRGAAQAEAAAVARSQEQIAKMREDFAREQIQRRRRFNLEWARLIREQNQEVLDAEWEYQFRKGNLLIEGDEIALAELEARYAHEKDVRARDQADARSDMREQFELENQQRQEQFERQLREQEQLLEQELENIRKRAEEEVEVKLKKLDDRLEREAEKRDERLETIGEEMAKELGDNEELTDLILTVWREMYGDLTAEAIEAGIVQRQELEKLRQAILQAQADLAALSATGASPDVRFPVIIKEEYEEGGYTPPAVTPVITHPQEYVLTAGTTRALEQATGGPLTQGAVRQLADVRRRLDVNLHGEGLPADIIAGIRRDLRTLTEAMAEEWSDFQ